MKSEASPLCAVFPEVPPFMPSLLASPSDALSNPFEEEWSRLTTHSSATIATPLQMSSALPLHDDLPLHTHAGAAQPTASAPAACPHMLSHKSPHKSRVGRFRLSPFSLHFPHSIYLP